MARIVSVTFETTTQNRAGAFAIPRAAANVLGIGADDPVELRIVWEGGKLELSTQLRSGWEIYPRSTDTSTRGLDDIPPRAALVVTVWRHGEDSELPDSLGEVVPAARPSGSDLGRQYQRVFQAVLDRFKILRPGATGRARVATDNWFSFSAGRAGFQFVWSTARRKYFRIELYIDTGAHAENKRHFDKLQERGAELERELGQPISWERLDAKRASRIAVYYAVPGDDFDTDPELIEWAAQTMATFVDVFGPAIRAI